MIIHADTQERLISETTVGAGSTSREGSILSDSLLATLWVNSITSGTLSVSVYTLTDVGKQVLLFSFPVLNTGTVDLLLKKSGVSMQRFLVVATYTGIVSYEIYVRAISGAGESSSQILGAASLVTSQTTVSTTPTTVIASSLTDRNGLIIKNWSTVNTLYVSEDISKLPGSAWPLAPRDALALDIVAGVTIYGVADAGTIDVRIAEAGG